MKYRLLPFLLSALPAAAAPLVPLPDPIATVDGTAISAERIKKAWEKSLNALPDHASGETMERIFRNLTDEAIWQKEIAAMLAGAGIRTDRETAQKYLAVMLAGLPPEQAEKLKSANTHAPDSPGMQLKAAIHCYLKRIVPEEISVSAHEVEDFYWNNRMRFRVPEKNIAGILAFSDLETAQKAQAELRQGVHFDTVAQQYGSGSTPRDPDKEILKQLRTMKLLETRLFRSAENQWFLVQLKERQKERFIPLSHAAPRIKLELAAHKEGEALGRILQKRLSAKTIRYSKLFDRKDPAVSR